MDTWIKMYTFYRTDVENLVLIEKFATFVLLKKSLSKKNKSEDIFLFCF